MITENTKKLKEWIESSDNIVFFGGAGVSTESGIPDFRSVDGLYNMKYKYPPETILSHDFFMKQTADFYDFYKDKMIILGSKYTIWLMSLILKHRIEREQKAEDNQQ